MGTHQGFARYVRRAGGVERALSDTSTSFDGEPCDRTKEGSCLCGREWSLTMWTRETTRKPREEPDDVMMTDAKKNPPTKNHDLPKKPDPYVETTLCFAYGA